MDEIAVKVDAVSKDFRLPSEKYNSLKSHVIHPFKRRTFSKQHALRDVSIDIKKGEFFGIVGRNGSGKSTLLKMIAGIYQPTKGSIQNNGKLVPFIELGVGFNPELTGQENVYLNGALLGFSEKEIDAMYDDIVGFAELEAHMGQKLKNYSSGMQVRLAFSMAVRAQADILLIDEVLAVGDADFQRKCFAYFKQLKKDKKTVIFVSHNMDAIREFCDRAMLLEDSKKIIESTPSEVAREYSLLFTKERTGGDAADQTTKRWGNGAVVFKHVAAQVVDDKVVITANAKVAQPVDRIMYGLHIIAQDGQEITATNNRMLLEPDITNVQQDQDITFKWEMLNVFNDGTYFVSLTLTDDLTVTLDWFVEAASFKVKRSQRSTTAILPPVKVTTGLN